MRLYAAIVAYMILKRALGAVFAADGRILRSFGRALGDVPVAAISSEQCQAFCRGSGPPTRFWPRKHQALQGFFRYLLGRGHVAVSPLAGPAPQVRSTFDPYIYSHDELGRLLDAAASQATGRSLVEPRALRTLLLVLYGAGLRASEALRLRCCDVDLRDQVLAVWDTKFFKSRLVPVGASLCRALELYLKERERLPLLEQERSRFFATRTGRAIPLGRLEDAFVRLRERAGVRRPDTERWQPRLHDLRATFAVHRLIAWYREGADVQARLPLLSTYLGHINVSGTKTYLTMTPELLTEASLRFQRYASPGKEHDHD